MSRVMYLDCFSGAAGDMLLAALLDAGLPDAALREALGSLGVGHDLLITRVQRAGISALHFAVGDARGGAHAHEHQHSHEHQHAHEHQHGPHRSLADIEHDIRHSALSAAARDRAVSLFRRLAEAEAAIHDVPLDQVHLHEVGAVDSIIDVVGAVFALEWFGIDDVVASPLNVGGGSVDIAHGSYPVPAPATMRLLIGVPVYSRGPRSELVTPTGALLVSAYARAYGPMPAMTVDRVGYGAGTRDHHGFPNVLRVVLGERLADQATSGGADDVLKIECEIDDMNPQLFGPVSDRLFATGALDVFLTPVQMKKGRPGTLLTVLASVEARAPVVELLFRETTTIGVRYEQVRREVLDRRWETVAISGGEVRVKVASRNGQTLGAAPEFDDCLRIADATGQPVRQVQAAAIRAWSERNPSSGQ
jgi:hypothetical protein